MKIPTSDRWTSRSTIEDCAGPLYSSGAHAAADIVCETGTISGRCGTACSGSSIYQCC
jgi:hypothetical protein